MENALQPELAFLDIQMPGLTGLEVAQGIEGDTRVVFVTAYDEFAVQAFESEAIDYVLKPVSRERLARTVERIRRAIAPSAPAPAGELLAALQRLLPAAAAAPERLRWVRASAGELLHQIDARRDEASRLFLRVKGHAQELPLSRAYVHLFKAM